MTPYAGDRMATSQAERTRALMLLALCGVFWSSAGVLIKFVSWHPLAIWSVRCAISGAALYAITRPSLRGLTRAEWGVAVTHAATTGLFIAANKLTTPANAILIQYSAPVWVAMFGAWMLNERARRADWLTIVVVLSGIALFFLDQLEFSHMLGNGIALLAGMVFALNTMLLRLISARAVVAPAARRNPLRAVVVGNMLGAVIGAPFCFMHAAPDATGWLALLGLGLVQQTAAYLCYGWAIRRVTALEGLLVPIVEPILSPIWVMAIFGQRPSHWALLGGVIVVGAVTARAVLSLRRPAVE